MTTARVTRAFSALLAGFLLTSSATLASAATPKMRTFVIDVGTGLGVYVEIPSPREGERPLRVIYDTGKGAGSGIDNDLVSFLVSEEVGLKPAEGDFEGDVIDYFVLSHPHEDHYNGAKPLFDLFDVRNIIESKQIHSVKYLKRFKGPALAEIADAKTAGKDAHYYVVGLPYPNHFDEPRDGQPYDEYALCQKNLPDFMADVIDCKKHQGKVAWPFGPDQVAQRISWPMFHLMGESEKAMKYLREDLHDAELEVDVIPLGTRFDLAPRKNGGFTVVHGDSIAAFDHAKNDRQTYRDAFPYYKEDDLNDGSVSIQVTYGKASLFIPGDTEGRDKKPTKRFSLREIFGSGEGQDAYTAADLEQYLRRDKPKRDQLPILPMAEPYVASAPDLLRLGFYAFASYEFLTPEPFEAKFQQSPLTILARDYHSPADIPDSAVFLDKRNDLQKERLHPRWRERLFGFFKTIQENNQKKNALKSRFKSWIKGSKPRMVLDPEHNRFMPDWQNPVWTITNLVQLTERIYYVDPWLAHLLAGFIMRSDVFLDYIAPREESEQTGRGEKHMIHVADAILADGGPDVLRSDVLFFGHHGSFTSSSFGFVQRVNPNVGIISADDKSYSGSTLPDFSAMFWNLNSHHPKSRAILHSIFFHADLLALKRGEPVDGYAWRNRFSQSASKIFRRRKRWPIPIWRTDFNDDLEDSNTLIDNIRIETDGSRPIWKWSRHEKGKDKDLIPEDRDGIEDIPDYHYWFQTVGFNPKKTGVIRPKDPSGEITSFPVGTRLEIDQEWDDADADDEAEDWTHVH